MLESSKTSLNEMYHDVVAKLAYILRQWYERPVKNGDVDPQERIRRAYLTDLVIAYNSVHLFAGNVLDPMYLTKCMDLAIEVAKPGNDIAAIILETGRMEELLTVFMSASYAIMEHNELQTGDSRSTKTKRGEGNGATLAVWNIHKEVPMDFGSYSTG
jgi:nuclear pore complex protein Nup107